MCSSTTAVYIKFLCGGVKMVELHDVVRKSSVAVGAWDILYLPDKLFHFISMLFVALSSIYLSTCFAPRTSMLTLRFLLADIEKLIGWFIQSASHALSVKTHWVWFYIILFGEICWQFEAISCNI